MRQLEFAHLRSVGNLISRPFFPSSRWMAFSAAFTAADLVSCWPLSTTPATDADHFQTPRSMPCTTVYSVPWYFISENRKGARVQPWALIQPTTNAGSHQVPRRGRAARQDVTSSIGRRQPAHCEFDLAICQLTPIFHDGHIAAGGIGIENLARLSPSFFERKREGFPDQSVRALHLAAVAKAADLFGEVPGALHCNWFPLRMRQPGRYARMPR